MSSIMDMSGFTKAVVGMIVGALILMVALQVFPMIVDIGNDIFLMTRPSGAAIAEINGKRFDKVAVRTNDKDAPEDFESSDWATISVASGGVLTLNPAPPSSAPKTLILPGGTEITETTSTEATTFTNTGIKQAKAVRFLQKGSLLITTVITAIALLLSVAPLAMLGGVGYMFLGRFTTGMSSITRVIVAVIGVVIGGTVLTTFVTFIDVAYVAIDGKRFSVFASGLGSLATTLTEFWGVIFAIGLIVQASVFAFQGIGRYRRMRSGGGGDSALAA